jgi:phosphatidylglycerophosphate synthase
MRRWGLVGAAGWLVTYAEVRRFGSDHVQLRLLPGLAWWLAVWQMLDWHLGEAEGGDGIPRRRLGPADAVTLARFWLVPVVSGAQWSARELPLVIAAGGLTDAVDGWLARRDGRTRLGRDLDTFADFAFMSAAVRAGWRSGRITSTAPAGLADRHALGAGIATRAVFGEARRPAIRARRWGGALRIGGLVAATAGARRLGNAMLTAGSLVPPRNTTPGKTLTAGPGRLS